MRLNDLNIILEDEIVFGDIEITKDKISNIFIKGKENKNYNYLCPGLIDVHTHGANGFDFNTIKTKEDIKLITDFYVSKGVTTVLATVMTDSKLHLKEKLGLIGTYINEFKVIKGIHLEGPFLSKAFKGAHEEKYLLNPSPSLFFEFNSYSNFNIKYITIAPELDGAIETIKYLKENDINVSIGHSEASYYESLNALKNGASSFTHTFNAMKPYNHHDLTISFASIFIPKIYNELILDGKHVDPLMCKFLYEVKGIDYIIGITDSLSPTGLKSGTYLLGNQEIEVNNSGCFIKNAKTRAGSNLICLDGVKNSMKFFDISLEKAFRIYSLNPARRILLDKKIGSIKINKKADLFIMDKSFNVLKTYINGELVYSYENNS